MIKIASTIITTFMLMMIAVCVYGDDTSGAKEDVNILLLGCESENYSRNNVLGESMATELEESVLYEYKIYYETFDAELSKDSDYLQSNIDFIKNKYKNINFEFCVITSDNVASIANKYLNASILSEAKIIYCYFDGRKPAFSNDHDTSGKQSGFISNSIKSIFNLVPRVDKFVVIHSDNTDSFFISQYAISDVLTQQYSYLDAEFLDLGSYSYLEILNKVALLDDGAVVLIVGHDCYSQHYYGQHGLAHELCNKSKVPVFSFDSECMGCGVAGGYLVSAERAGQIAAGMVAAKINDIIDANNFEVAEYMYDLDAFLTWQLPVDAIPANSYLMEAGEYKTPLKRNSSSLSSREIQWIGDTDKVSVFAMEQPPLAGISGRLNGIAIDYVAMLAKEVGLELEYVYDYKSIDDIISGVNFTQEPVIIPAIEMRENLQETLAFTEPWISMNYTLFVSKEENNLIYELEALSGKTVAVEKNSVVFDTITERYPEIELMPLPTVEEGLKAVDEGRVFGWIGGHSVGIYSKRYYDLDNVKVGCSLGELGQYELSIAVPSGNAILYDIMCKMTARMDDNDLIALRRSYSDNLLGGGGVSKDVLIGIALVMAGVFLLVLLGILVRIKNASILIRRSKDRMSIAFNSIGDAIIVTDCNGVITRINHVAEEITQWGNDSAVGQPVVKVFDVVDPYSFGDIVCPVDTVLKRIKAVDDSVAALISADGHRLFISYSVAPVITGRAGCKGAVLVFRDITKQFEMEQRVKRAEKERELILGNITVGVCFYDKKYQPVRYNKQMEVFCRDYMLTNLDGLGQGGQEGRRIPGQLQKNTIVKEAKQGETKRYLEVTAMPVMENGAITGVLEMAVDVTEYRELQDELEKAYNELRDYSGSLENQVKMRTFELQDRNDQLDTAMTELKSAQSQLILSEKMAALGQLISGISKDITNPLGVIGASGNIIRKCITHLVRNLRDVDSMLSGEYKDALQELLSDAIVYSQSGICLSTREVRSVRNSLINDLKEELDSNQISYIASQLIALGVAGKWKYYLPLLKLDNCLDILYEISSIVNISASCTVISKEVIKASGVVSALKSYVHKSNYGKDNVQQENVFDVTEGIQVVLALFKSKMKCDIDLKTDFRDIPQVKGYSDELNQVWTNIIQNSVQAMPYGGLLSVSSYSYDEGVLIEFSDTGCGMSEDVRMKAFEPLFTTKSVDKGSGLGLDIVKRIVEDNHNGKVTIESKEQEGTVVKVWLPKAEVELV